MSSKAPSTHIQTLLDEITLHDGSAATDRFGGLRDVDAKIREAKLILRSVPGVPSELLDEMDADYDFNANSRRVRLEALANYCRLALRALEIGTEMQAKPKLQPAPDVSSLTPANAALRGVIERRWLDAQRCVHAGAFLAGVIMMGSILEGLLLARAKMDLPRAYQAKCAPKTKGGGNRPIEDWTLNSLIDAAVELGWLGSDRGKFSHALRESRNVVHPWAEVSSNASFDLATCRTCWIVLTSSVKDLIDSI